MWLPLKRILQAAFVLPFTSGLVKERRNGNYSKHDGSIAGLVLLTTTVIMTFEIMCLISIHNSRIVMTVLLCIALSCLGFCGLKISSNPHLQVSRHLKHCEKLKMKFLWLFVVANISYQGINLSDVIKCNSYSTMAELVSYFIISWLFQLSQAVFIQILLKYKFPRILSMYYGLLVLFVANISLWTHRTVTTYFEATSSNATFPEYSCDKNTSGYLYTEKVKPFLDPALLEYCLLSLIFLSEMWPSEKSSHYIETRDVNKVTDEDDAETDPLLGNADNNSSPETYCCRKSSTRVMIIGIVYASSFVIIETLTINIQKVRHYFWAVFLYYVIGNFVRIPLLVKCFFDLSGQLRPKTYSKNGVSLKHVILLVSSMATCGYIIVECIQYQEKELATLRIILNGMFRIIGVVLQTCFILQMKHYQKRKQRDSLLSSDSTFLFLCITNVGLWFSYTFVQPQYFTIAIKATHYFQFITWLKIKHFWFPFVIFYHFECFVFFYGFFRKEKRSKVLTYND